MEQKKKLVDHNGQIDGAKNKDGASGPFECAVETQKHEAKGDNSKFPDPELLAMKVNHRANDRVHLDSFRIQNHHGEERVENIETHNEDQKGEQGRTVPVHVAPLFLICLSTDSFSSPKKGVATDQRGWFLSAIF
jgi:hypothetical protein